MQVKYLDMLPTICEDTSEGVVRALIVEDMMKHGSIFFAQEPKGEDMDFAPLETVAEVLFEVYDKPENPIVVWNKSLEYKIGFFQFNPKNEKIMMLFDLDKNEKVKNKILLNIKERLGEDMAKVCPKDGNYVLYLDCLECEDKADCKNKGKEDK